jgi:hypothetical protein
MMAIKVTKKVRERLLAGEEVVGKVSGSSTMWDSVDYYATTKRMLRFERSGWWLFFFGFLGFLKKKEYSGALEYSRISGTTLVARRPTSNVIIGLVFGPMMLLAGVCILALSSGSVNDASFYGWLLILLGLFFLAMFCGIKQTYYQFQARDLSEKEMKEWRIYLPKLGPKAKEIREFAIAVEARASAIRPARVEPATTPPPSARAKLILPDNSEISLAEETRSIGRSDFEETVPAKALSYISRQHLRISYENGDYFIEDRNSANGTKLNGVDIKGKGWQGLKDGDRIDVADVTTLTFKT